jgi:hypothetical protein
LRKELLLHLWQLLHLRLKIFALRLCANETAETMLARRVAGVPDGRGHDGAKLFRPENINSYKMALFSFSTRKLLIKCR